MVSDRSKRRAFGMRGRVSVATRVISLKRIYFEGAWPLSDTRQEYKRARDEGERGGGARRRRLLVRRKEESGASTCIFHSFAILSIEEYVEERRERGRERGSGPSSSTTPFSSSIATERMLASFLSSRFQEGTHDLEAQTPAPPRSYFCKALFFRNAGPTIVFPVPPLRSSSLCSIPSIWSRYIRRVSLSLYFLSSYHILSLTPSNSFRCRHPSSLPARRVGLESVLRGELERRDDGVALLLGQLYRFEENMDTCWSMSRRVFNAANQKLENSYYPSIFARNIRILYI